MSNPNSVLSKLDQQLQEMDLELLELAEDLSSKGISNEPERRDSVGSNNSRIFRQTLPPNFINSKDVNHSTSTSTPKPYPQISPRESSRPASYMGIPVYPHNNKTSLSPISTQNIKNDMFSETSDNTKMAKAFTRLGLSDNEMNAEIQNRRKSSQRFSGMDHKFSGKNSMRSPSRLSHSITIPGANVAIPDLKSPTKTVLPTTSIAENPYNPYVARPVSQIQSPAGSYYSNRSSMMSSPNTYGNRSSIIHSPVVHSPGGTRFIQSPNSNRNSTLASPLSGRNSYGSQFTNRNSMLSNSSEPFVSRRSSKALQKLGIAENDIDAQNLVISSAPEFESRALESPKRPANDADQVVQSGKPSKALAMLGISEQQLEKETVSPSDYIPANASNKALKTLGVNETNTFIPANASAKALKQLGISEKVDDSLYNSNTTLNTYDDKRDSKITIGSNKSRPHSMASFAPSESTVDDMMTDNPNSKAMKLLGLDHPDAQPNLVNKNLKPKSMMNRVSNLFNKGIFKEVLVSVTVQDLSSMRRVAAGYLAFTKSATTASKSRYFILTETMLYMFKTHNKKEKMVDSISINQFCALTVINLARYTFQLSDSNSAWVLVCQSKNDFDTWCREINSTISLDKFSTAKLPPIPKVEKEKELPVVPDAAPQSDEEMYDVDIDTLARVISSLTMTCEPRSADFLDQSSDAEGEESYPAPIESALAIVSLLQKQELKKKSTVVQ
ncbi:hypothetical protein HDV01_001705 [Terramyces sp. JEL0728]|nr:hypothetical protein HDV01_001705 [Terramyces sp. JEL0728]